MKTEMTVSVIIPTHNRRDSLERLLITLEEQNYPMETAEVIVISDGSTDSTLDMLQNFRSTYSLHYLHQSSSGPAVARNAGASIATGSVLIFLDDDIEPAPSLIREHCDSHREANNIVIGNLPLKVEPGGSFFLTGLRTWWQNKYEEMKHPGYRFTYADLLSGNFSIRTKMFKEVNGFDTTFRCREDYEFGARLVKHGGNFIYNNEAWGYHNDQSNSITRSFKRKIQEGKADVQFGYKHPDLLQTFPLYKEKNRRNPIQLLIVYSAFHLKGMSRILMDILTGMLPTLEKNKMRSTYRRVNTILHRYWYFRGVAERLESYKAFHTYLKSAISEKRVEELEIDLEEGLLLAERRLDRIRPAVVELRFGIFYIGKLRNRPEAENLKGRHLRTILATEFADALKKSVLFSTEPSYETGSLQLQKVS